MLFLNTAEQPTAQARPCRCGATIGWGERRCMACHRSQERKRYRDNPQKVMKRRAERPVPPSQTREGRRQWCLDNPERQMLHSARIGAKRQGRPCTITAADIFIPEFCPLLGIKLKRATNVRTDNSPSIDKIEPQRGYVPGNVWVISWRANRIKNDASLRELRTIVENLAKAVHKFPWELT